MSNYVTIMCLTVIALIAVIAVLTAKRDGKTLIVMAIREASKGICPRCRNVHPENVQHGGQSAYWMVFTCPVCGYNIKAHVTDDHDR